MSIFLSRGQRQCRYCGRRAGLDHLCDEPGPSLHGATGAVELAEGVWRLPDGTYAMTHAAMTEAGIDGATVTEALNYCLEADGAPARADRDAHTAVLSRLRRAADVLRARAWEARLGEQIVLDDVVEEGRAA